MNTKLKLVLVFLGGVITTLLIALYFLRDYIAYFFLLLSFGLFRL